MQEAIKALKALSDETRLRIINVLVKRECCVCEVMQALDISQSRASRNLGILEDTGFLKARRDGAWLLYPIDCETTNRYAASSAEPFNGFFIDDEELSKDRERLKHTARIGPGCGKERQNKVEESRLMLNLLNLIVHLSRRYCYLYYLLLTSTDDDFTKR